MGTLTAVTVAGAATLNGHVTLGDGVGDAVTVNGKMAVANGIQQTTTTVAAAGANQGAATAIVVGLSSILVTSTGANQGVLLPTPAAGNVITLIRGTATNVVKVYPGTGHTANGGGANAAVTMGAADQVFVCTALSGTGWECLGHGGGAITTGTRRRLSTGVSADDAARVLELESTIVDQATRIDALEKAVHALMKKLAA